MVTWVAILLFSGNNVTSASEEEDTPDNQSEQEMAMICFLALDEAEQNDTREIEASADEAESIHSNSQDEGFVKI